MHLTSFMRTILYRATFVKRAPSKSIMTTPRKMQELLQDLKGNPYYDKYAGKISQLQKEDPNEFKNRVEGADKSKLKKTEPSKERQYSQLLKPKQSINDSVQLKRKPLDKIMKIDLIKDKTADEVKSIWEQYHLHKDFCIAATIPAKDFDKLNENCRQFPTFLFALPRSQGYEFIMCQFAENSVHFTPLLCYQVHKENAPECLTITHYDEFKDSKEIVLMTGEYDKNVIDAREAQCLANQLQMYYIQDEPEKRTLLETFTRTPDKFKHTDLIKQIENMSLT